MPIPGLNHVWAPYPPSQVRGSALCPYICISENIYRIQDSLELLTQGCKRIFDLGRDLGIDVTLYHAGLFQSAELAGQSGLCNAGHFFAELVETVSAAA